MELRQKVTSGVPMERREEWWKTFASLREKISVQHAVADRQRLPIGELRQDFIKIADEIIPISAVYHDFLEEQHIPHEAEFTVAKGSYKKGTTRGEKNLVDASLAMKSTAETGKPSRGYFARGDTAREEALKEFARRENLNVIWEDDIEEWQGDVPRPEWVKAAVVPLPYEEGSNVTYLATLGGIGLNNDVPASYNNFSRVYAGSRVVADNDEFNFIVDTEYQLLDEALREMGFGDELDRRIADIEYGALSNTARYALGRVTFAEALLGGGGSGDIETMREKLKRLLGDTPQRELGTKFPTLVSDTGDASPAAMRYQIDRASRAQLEQYITELSGKGSREVREGHHRLRTARDDGRKFAAQPNPIDTGDGVPWVKIARDPDQYKEAMKKAEAIGPMDDAACIYKLLGNAMLKEDQEVFLVVLLDVRQQCRGVVEAHRGERSRVGANITDILRAAVKGGAEGVVVAHNHPSGKATPSNADRELTDAIEKGCGLLDIAFVDHVVLGNGEYFSFADNKLHKAKKKEAAA
jgi:proteasome lid subunit RPN8/RPN11